MEDDFEKSRNSIDESSNLMRRYDNVMANISLDVDADLEDIFCALGKVEDDAIDLEEMTRLREHNTRIADPRQLGDWITINVDANKKKISCNCEQCNRYGQCALVACMRVIQFNEPVPDHCKQVNEGFGWDVMVNRARDVMQKVNITY